MGGILELVKANIAPSIPCYDLKGQMEIDEEKNGTEDLPGGASRRTVEICIARVFYCYHFEDICTVQNSAHSVRLFPIQSERRFWNMRQDEKLLFTGGKSIILLELVDVTNEEGSISEFLTDLEIGFKFNIIDFDWAQK